MLQVIFVFIYFIVSSTPFVVGRNRFSKKNAPLGERVISFCLVGVTIRNCGRVLTGQGAWLKTPKFSAFSGNVNTINFKISFPHGRIYRFERKFSKQPGER